MTLQIEANRFWRIINRVHSKSDGSMDLKCDLLKQELAKLLDVDLLEFSSQFDQADANAYTWPLWGAAYILYGGCSDDAFTDFRSTLISMGSEIYSNALADPNTLESVTFDGNNPCYEGYAYALYDTLEEHFGEIPQSSIQFPEEPTGEEWDEGLVENLFPSLKQLELAANPLGLFRNARMMGLALTLGGGVATLLTYGIYILIARFKGEPDYHIAGMLMFMPVIFLLFGGFLLIGGDKAVHRMEEYFGREKRLKSKKRCPKCGLFEVNRVQHETEPVDQFLLTVDPFGEGKKKTEYICSICKTKFEARSAIAKLSFLFYWGFILFIIAIIIINSGWF